MKFYQFIIPLTSFMILTNCSNPQSCDPDKTNFFSGLGCSVGSGYNKRSQNLNNQLQYEQQNAVNQQQNAAQAHSESIGLQARLEQRRAQLTQIDNQAWAVRKKLQDARANHSLTQQQLNQKQKLLDNYNARRSRVNDDPSQQDLNALSAILGKM